MSKATTNRIATNGKQDPAEVVAAPAKSLLISAPDFRVAEFRIRGTAPYVQNKFSAKAAQAIREKHEAGDAAKNKRSRAPKDFDELYEGCQHRDADGRHGIPAAAFRNACISACRVAGFAMTKAKMSVFCLADTTDAEDGSPLVFIEGTPEKIESLVRNDSGVCDIRPRAMWREWSATVRLRYDANQFVVEDIANMLMRAGMQVGVGEGRPDSKDSNGMNWGTFECVAD